MAQSVARKGAPVLRIAYPIWVFSVILIPMPPLPVAPYERTSLDRPGWSGSCQQGKSSDSIDHLVGDRKDARRNGQAEGPGGLEVDHQLELGRLHDRQVGRLLTF